MDRIILDDKLFILNGEDNQFSAAFLETARTRITTIGTFFGFYYLPESLKIQITTLSKDLFRQLLQEKLKINVPDGSVAISSGANKVFIISYPDLKEQYSENGYLSLVVHECAHLFQLLFSQVNTTEYTWLYETVACYLARQEAKVLPTRKIEWESFTTSFYGVENCYALAYLFGKMLFQIKPEMVIKEMLRNPHQYVREYQNIYERIWDKRLSS